MIGKKIIFLLLAFVIHFEIDYSVAQNELTKCCDSGQIIEFNVTSGFVQCSTPNMTEEEEPFSDNKDPFNASTEVIVASVTNKTIHFPNCSSPAKILTNADDIWFRINAKNQIEVGLLWPFEPVWITIPEGKYCINQQKSSNPFETSNDALRNHLLYLCASDLEDYQIYLISRYFVGACDLISVVFFIAIVVIYMLLRKIHTVVGWLICLICSTSVPFFTTFGVLTIVNAQWLDVESTTTCEVWYSLARYLQVVLTLCNLVINIHMLRTFWKMTRRVTAMNQSIAKFKMYIPIIFLVPALIVIVDQTFARVYRGSKFVKDTHKYGHGRCSPPETEFFDHCLSVMILLTLVVVLTSGCVILYLKLSSNIRQHASSSSSKTGKQFVDTSKLFLKLLFGSGFPIIVRFLAFLYIGKKDPLKWYFTAIFCGTQIFTAAYYFVVFGIPQKHRHKLRLLWQGKPIHSITESSNPSTVSNNRQNKPPISSSAV